MVIVNKEVKCKICGRKILYGEMASLDEGYICLNCISQLLEKDPVKADVTVDVDTVLEEETV